MKIYSVKFNCMIPCEIDTVIEAENVDDVVDKIMKNEFENFKYRTIGKMHDIGGIKLKELNI